MGLHVFPSAARRMAPYSNYKIHVIGQVREICTVCGQLAKLIFLIVVPYVKPVLVQNACDLLNFVKGVHTVSVKPGEDVFQGISCIKAFVYDADIKKESSKSGD